MLVTPTTPPGEDPSPNDFLTRGEADLLYGGATSYKVTELLTRTAAATTMSPGGYFSTSSVLGGVLTYSNIITTSRSGVGVGTGVYVTVYDKVGIGVLENIIVYASDSSVRSMSVRITVDGTVILDKSTVNATQWDSNPVIILGHSTYQFAASALSSGGYPASIVIEPVYLFYKEDIKIEIASSLASDGAINFGYKGYILE
jgi:hypothetical protein